jgi:hypothetical protein
MAHGGTGVPVWIWPQNVNEAVGRLNRTPLRPQAALRCWQEVLETPNRSSQAAASLGGSRRRVLAT